MTQNAIWDAEGNVLYYWHDHEMGIHFQFEYFTDPLSMIQDQTEIQFILPTSEFSSVYTKFEIDENLDIHQALNTISAAGRGDEFCNELDVSIRVINRFVSMS